MNTTFELKINCPLTGGQISFFVAKSILNN
jgi:hypothetical protein